MTKEIVKYMCEGKSPTDIARTYSKSVIVQMYRCLYSIEPHKSKNASEIAYAVWSFLADEERTRDLCKLLR